MANQILDKELTDKKNAIPSTVQGNGQNFIYILKKYLEVLSDEINTKFKEVSKLFNAINNAPETIDAQVYDLRVEERKLGAAISLVLTWETNKIDKYAGTNIYVYEQKTKSGMTWTGVEVSRTISTPLANKYVLENVTAGYSYKIVVQGRTTLGSVSDPAHNPTVIWDVSAADNVPEPPEDFHVYSTKDGILWTWKQPQNHNSYVTELRTDKNPGNPTNLLEVTQDTISTVLPPTREGKAYLYNKGFGYRYSDPVDTTWSKPVPVAPQNLKATPIFQGLKIEYGRIPDDCQGICISINEELYYTSDQSFNFNCSTGAYKIKCAYYDVFGKGTWSNEISMSTIEEIPPSAVHITDQTVFDNGVIIAKYIGDKQVVGTKIADGVITTDKLAADAVTAGKIAANAITANKIQSNAITSDKIDVGAITADKIQAGSIDSDKLKADSILADKIHSEAITSDKIAAGAVTAEKISVEKLSAISAALGKFKSAETGMRVEISGTLIAVYDQNDVLRVRLGLF